MSPRRSARDKQGAVRIISGKWRGRSLKVTDRPGLRPTASRNRETLFNWLQPDLPGAHVLDLFAGSGALGFEALSRGAASATLVERDQTVAGMLRHQASALEAQNCTIVSDDAIAWLAKERPATEPYFDLVFIDPPFESDLINIAPKLLEESGWLHPRAWIYVEFGVGIQNGLWPWNWQEYRRTESREACCVLFQRNSEEP